MSGLLAFVVIAILAAILLGALTQFPNLDATMVKIIRIVVFVVLAVLLLNLLLSLVFHTSIGAAIGSA